MIKEVPGSGSGGCYPAIEVKCYPSPNDSCINIACVTLIEAVDGRIRGTNIIDRQKISCEAAIERARTEAQKRGMNRIYVQ